MLIVLPILHLPPSFGSRSCSYTFVVARACVPVPAHAPTWGRRGLSHLQLQLIDDLVQGGKTPSDIIADIQNLDNVLKSGNRGGPVMSLSSVHKAKVRTERESAAAALSLG